MIEKRTMHTPRILPPSLWVERFIGGVPAGGTVLDLACGSGRHLRLALERGYGVLGVDRALDGVRDLEGRPSVALLECDLEDNKPFPLAGRGFAGVLVTNYLWRPLLPQIVAAVSLEGVLIYETFAIGQEQFGRPSNPEFLLRPNELIDAVRPRLTVVAYEHGRLDEGGRSRIVQRIAACGPAHPWSDRGFATKVRADHALSATFKAKA